MSKKTDLQKASPKKIKNCYNLRFYLLFTSSWPEILYEPRVPRILNSEID